jgi:CheY-like chemotaxis protein
MKPYGDVDILLVEDDAYDAETTMLAIAAGNITNTIHWVRDGSEALDFIACTGAYLERDPARMPKLILLDLKMPQVDGFDVLRVIKSDPSTRAIPVVVMTSSRQERDVTECYTLGANAYVVKPVNFADFGAAVAGVGAFWMHINTVP